MNQHEKRQERRPLHSAGSVASSSAPTFLAYAEGEGRRMEQVETKELTAASNRLFAGTGAQRLDRADLTSIIRSDRRVLALYLLIVVLCATLTIVSIFSLYFELTTGALFSITGEVIYGSKPTSLTLDPMSFTISAGLGLLLTTLFAWLAVKRADKLKLARHIRGRFRKRQEWK